MFNPNELMLWASQLKLNHSLAEFDGHTTQSIVLHTPSVPPFAGCENGQLYRPTKIFGNPTDPTCLLGIGDYAVPLATPMLTVNANARVVGFCAIITEDLRLLAPHEITTTNVAEFVSHNEYNHQGFLFQPVAGGLKVNFRSDLPPRRVAGKALFLHNIEPGNYGSFIFRQLPQMVLAAQRGIEADFYIVADRTVWLREAIMLSGLPARPIFTVREVCGNIFDEIIMISGVDNGGFLSSSVRQGIAAFADKGRHAVNAAPAPEKIYVSRLLSAHDRPWYRVMHNEADIESVVQGRGYTVVYPETMSMPQQISIFSNASSIIGPSGSGMFNSIFSREKCKIVDIETFHVTVAQHALFYASTGRDYSFLFATPEPKLNVPKINRPYRMDSGTLELALEWCTA